MKYNLIDTLSEKQVIVCKLDAYFMASHACNKHTSNLSEVLLFPCNKDGMVVDWFHEDAFKYASIEEFIGNECAIDDDYDD